MKTLIETSPTTLRRLGALGFLAQSSLRSTPQRAWLTCGMWLLLLLQTLGVGCWQVVAAEAPATGSANYSDLSIEELMDVSVTSVSKREQKLSDTASAVSVLFNDDLRRSGATSVAEALRSIPGMSIGSISASQWAISARGFNSLYANKLLVLVDGRAVYTPSFSGVYWDLLQTPLEDVERIEVIRGPGATVWGANAVNGVINVVSKSAKDSQGGLAYGGGGDVHQVLGGARYGGKLGEDTYYRVFGGYQLNSDYLLANGSRAQDTWQGAQGGFRIDHYSQDSSHLTWQGDATISDVDSHDSTGYDVNTLARWSRNLSERSSVEVQAYFDRFERTESSRSKGTVNTVDLTAQHTLSLGDRNELMWGVGYRLAETQLRQTSPLIQIRAKHLSLQVFNAFVQDEFQLIPDKLALTVGTKLEHNDFTGLELQPSVRLVLKPTEHQSLWAAVSRATRTPSELEGRDAFGITFGAPITGPGGFQYTPTLVGNRSVESEILWAYELGYRVQLSRKLSLDAALFYNKYSRIIALTDSIQFVSSGSLRLAEIPWMNAIQGKSYGGEASLTWSALDQLRLIGSYSLLMTDLTGPAASNPQGIERSAPVHRMVLRTAYDFHPKASLDLQLRYEDNIMSVPAYVTADLRLSYHLSKNLELTLVGQNLLDNQHPEQPAASFSITSEVPRGFYGKVSWRF